MPGTKEAKAKRHCKSFLKQSVRCQKRIVFSGNVITGMITREWRWYKGKEHYKENEGEMASLNIFLMQKK